MKKHVILHIGPPKTGTSVLQNWFNANKELLAKHGVLYPEHRVDKNGVSSGNKDLFLDKCNESGVTKFNKTKYQSLLDNFKKGSFSRLLLSSEFFFSALPQILEASKGVKVEIVAYIRPEYEFLESIYNQSVKRNKQTEPIALKEFLPASYLDRLMDYIKIYGSEEFHLRGYGVGDFFPNGIVADFLSVLDIDEGDATSSDNQYINRSYSFECLEFKRWTNRFQLSGLDGELDSQLQAYDQGIKHYTVIPFKAYTRYQEQSKKKIDALNSLAPIANVDALFNYIDSSQRGDYYHQDLYDSHIAHVTHFILERDASLILSLIESIEKQANDDFDKEKLHVMKQCYLKYAESAKLQKGLWSQVVRKLKAIASKVGI